MAVHIVEDSTRPANVGIPWIAEDVVARRRVVEAILTGLARSHLVEIVAPAGAGKTTAVVQMTHEIEMPVAWLTLEEWDRHPGRFLVDLVEALSEVAPSVRSVLTTAAGEDPRTQASFVGTALGPRELLLVIDDVHLLKEWPHAREVLATVVRFRAHGLRTILVGRAAPMLPGLTAADVASTALLGEDVLRADETEAAAILRAHGSAADPVAAVEATGGWVAGLVLDPERRAAGEAGGSEALARYLSSEVRPRLTVEEDAFLVQCSIFDRIDRARSIALAGDEGPSVLDALRDAGLPALWDDRTTSLRLHPRVRELFRAELDRRPGDLRRAMHSAAAAYTREGDLELAVEAHIQADELEQAGRLLPRVLEGILARYDIDLARYLLDAVRLDPEPTEVVLARLALAFIDQDAVASNAILEQLERNGRLAHVVREEPTIGALACNIYMAAGRIPDAAALLDVMPRGRAANAARLLLSAVRDDAGAPIPSFAGDVLDSVIARGLFFRGRLDDLRGRADATLRRISGIPDLHDPDEAHPASLGAVRSRFGQAVETRDLLAARQAIAELEAMNAHFYAELSAAELAVRMEDDPARALEAVEELRAHAAAEVGFYRELSDMWEGAALLLMDGGVEKAEHILRRAVEGMRRGDRFLEIPAARVYLAEAQWRLGLEEEADRTTREAHAAARAHGGVRRFMLALADFPGVLSRALDLEQDLDGEWHALGRALAAGSSAARHLSAPSVHLRELGEATLVVDGVIVHARIRKSLEVLSFLLSRPAATARRTEVLTALWNGRDDDATRTYLRQAVRHLRDALPQGVAVTTERDSLSIVGAITSEVAELEVLLREASVARGATRRALLFDALEFGERGEFLDGSRDVRWVDDRRAAIESLLAGARLDAADLLVGEGRYLEALTLVDQALERNELLERGWRLRMQVVGMLGDGDGVVDALRRCRAALAEVDLEPSSVTLDLARRLRG